MSNTTDITQVSSSEMKNYIGVKYIKAFPMSRGDYNSYRGWEVPPKENPEEEGYLVEYPATDPPTPNMSGHNGYISWAPKEVFDQAHIAIGNHISDEDAAGVASALLDLASRSYGVVDGEA
jgi:hypothetical protein